MENPTPILLHGRRILNSFAGWAVENKKNSFHIVDKQFVADELYHYLPVFCLEILDEGIEFFARKDLVSMLGEVICVNKQKVVVGV